MDDDEYQERADGEEDDSKEDVAEGERASEMPHEPHTIVTDLGLLCFRYLEEYQTQ